MSDLNAVGVLKRREIEARILAPFVAALAAHHRGHAISQFAAATAARVQDDALTIEVLAQEHLPPPA